MKYIATFHSHYGAIAFQKALAKEGLLVTLKPVPRYLSSSCGTCGAFDAAPGFAPPATPEFDALYPGDSSCPSST